MAEAALLQLDAVTKRFGSLVANDKVSFDVGPGEVIGILGENGAGKSTLMNIISGLIRPDGGVITFEGREVDFDSPREVN